MECLEFGRDLSRKPIVWNVSSTWVRSAQRSSAVGALGWIHLDAQVELTVSLNDLLAYRASVLPEPAYGEDRGSDELSSRQSLPLSGAESRQIRPHAGCAHQRQAQGDQQHGRIKALEHPASALLKNPDDLFFPVRHSALLMDSTAKSVCTLTIPPACLEEHELP
jgi:hypothetical protein